MCDVEALIHFRDEVETGVSPNSKIEKNGEIDSNLLKELRVKNLNKLIIGTLNINSLRNKFEQLKVIIGNYLDILILSFTTTQFEIAGFSKPYRLDRNRFGGGILVYIREDIPSVELQKHTFKRNVEGLFIEINLRKMKLLLFATYHSLHEKYGMNDVDYLEEIGLALDAYKNYDKFLLTEDFNMEDEEPYLRDFLYEHSAKNLVREKACFKNIENPSCIYLFITNSHKSFQNTTVLSSGLSDCHKMIVTVMKSTFPRNEPKIVYYRDHKSSIERKFRNDLKNELQRKVPKDYHTFHDLFIKVLYKHFPYKKKTFRANHKPYISKIVRKAIMKRSMLQNKYYKCKTNEMKMLMIKQKNYTVTSLLALIRLLQL